jgi:putative transposase
MAQARFKLPSKNFQVAHYHVVSRCVDRRFVLERLEKDVFADMMRRYEAFCGLRVITFAVMSNHFHILVEVPRRPEEKDLPTDVELVQRVRDCYGKQAAWDLEVALKDCLKRADEAREPELPRDEEGKVIEAVGWRGRHHLLREKLFARMWDISPFMQSLKRKFSTWYNSSRETKRKGTLWEERFKSTAIMGPHALVAVAAYIDLNPVRAKIVKDPADYRWSGYGQACAGVKLARKAFSHLLGLLKVPGLRSDVAAMAWYRVYVFDVGSRSSTNSEGKVREMSFSKEQLAKVKAQQGALPAVKQLKCKVRYFTDGLVVGTKELVAEVFELKREHFGPKRRSGPRKMRHGGEWGLLSSMRELRADPP